MAAVPPPAFAEQATTDLGPQILVNGTGEVEIPPNQVTFSIGIATTAAAAAPASEENARISKAVSEALMGAGLKREEIVGQQLYVSPRWDWDEKSHRQKRSAFEATNTFQIKTDRIAQVGSYLDVALSAGATTASQVEFSAKDLDAARHQALGQAVAAARSDAEAIATAAGGGLGELQLLSTEQNYQSVGLNHNVLALSASTRSREPVSTEVVPSQIKVIAQITARWKFVPGPKSR